MAGSDESPDFFEIAKGKLLHVDPYTYAPQGDIMIAVLVRRRDFDSLRAGDLKTAILPGGTWRSANPSDAQDVRVSISIENPNAPRP